MYSYNETCCWVRIENGKKKYEQWEVRQLWTASEYEKVIDISVVDAVQKCGGWTKHLPDTHHPEVAIELPRIEKADLSYPILMHPAGWVMDGYHRIAKAVLAGDETIKAKIFTNASLPLPTIVINDYA